MAKPFDISKFHKDITKSIQGLSIGFNDPTAPVAAKASTDKAQDILAMIRARQKA
jgi:hypothetical protein